MYVSELFVDGECIIDSLAGPWKKLGVLGGDDLKNNNDDLKRPKNGEILVAHQCRNVRTLRHYQVLFVHKKKATHTLLN